MTDPHPIGPGALQVSGSFTARFEGDGADTLARMLGLTDPPRHHIKVDCPEDADRRCPVCGEPATTLTLEDVAVFGGGDATAMDARRRDGQVGYWMVGVDPAAYSVEPCGHRFDRSGKEISE